MEVSCERWEDPRNGVRDTKQANEHGKCPQKRYRFTCATGELSRDRESGTRTAEVRAGKKDKERYRVLSERFVHHSDGH